MAKKNKPGLSRREFIKLTGSGALAVGAGTGPFFLFPERAAAQQKTLKILQWSHFVPGYDKWFDGVFTKEWGQKQHQRRGGPHLAQRNPGAGRRGSFGEEGARSGHVP